MVQINFKKLLTKLPHQGPMRLIDSVVQIDERSIEATTHLNDERMEFLGSESLVEGYWGIELIAQAGALPLIAFSSESEHHAGVIIQVKSFCSFVPKLVEPAILTVRCSSELLLNGSIALVQGSISVENSLICEASVTLAMQNK